MDIDTYWMKIERKQYLSTNPKPIITAKPQKLSKKQKVQLKKLSKPNAKKRLKEIRSPKPVISNHKKKYLEYLESDTWAAIKLDLYAIRGKKCEKCGTKKQIQVHHIHYSNLYNEEPEDLILLCSGCHKKEHEVKNNELLKELNIKVN
jgi:5-methylcytosine-specific restriction endonuclease McrA